MEHRKHPDFANATQNSANYTAADGVRAGRSYGPERDSNPGRSYPEKDSNPRRSYPEKDSNPGRSYPERDSNSGRSYGPERESNSGRSYPEVGRETGRNYGPEGSGSGSLDRSASLALTKLMSTKRGGVVVPPSGGSGGGGSGPTAPPNVDISSGSPKPKNLMFNHKHLQYIPLAAHLPDHRRRLGTVHHTLQGQGQGHQTHQSAPMTSSLIVNGRIAAPHGPTSSHQQPQPPPINYHRQDPLQISPAQQQQYSERERALRYQQQQHQSQQQSQPQPHRLHHSPVTKSIGVGANLNYPRTGPTLGRPLGEVGQGQRSDVVFQHQNHQQQSQHHTLRGYEVPLPRSSPGGHGHGVLTISMGQSLGHGSDSSSLPPSSSSHSHHSGGGTRITELAATAHKPGDSHSGNAHGMTGQGQRSPLVQQTNQHQRSSSPGIIKPKFSALPAPSSLSSAQIEMLNSLKAATQKIVSQNLNGTLSVTGMPTNDSELQLFRVLQRANLLNYFDVMIELGGDDVQQLCDAGEEEFLEIMALIGMASKPLHVRRLQKSLQEFITHPNLFPNPILGPPLAAFTHAANAHHGAGANSDPPSSTTSATTTSSTVSKSNLPIRPIPFHGSNQGSNHVSNQGSNHVSNQGSNHGSNHYGSSTTESQRHYNPKFHALRGEQSQNSQTAGTAAASGAVSGSNNTGSPTVSSAVTGNGVGRGESQSPAKPGRTTPLAGNSNSNVPNSLLSPSSSTSSSNSNGAFPCVAAPFTLPNGISVRFPTEATFSESRSREPKVTVTGSENRSTENCSENPDSRSSLSPVPFLQEVEVEKIRESAIRLIQTLPDELLEPKVSAKRKAATDFETVIRIPDEDPKKAEEIRKFATIYARYNCKRKAQKPLTIHELSANEAASQLCLRLPALLTRREDLKLLSREVVRNAGLPYSSIISATTTFRDFGLNGRRTPLENNTEHTRPRSAPSHSNLSEDMSKNQSHRPTSSPASTEIKAHSPSDATVYHGPKKRATTAALALTSPKERKLDDDLRNFQRNSSTSISTMKYEEGS